MRSTYRAYEKNGIYFITSSIVEFIPIFTDKSMFGIIADAFEHCRREKYLKLFAYVIMDNHFHAVLSAPDLSKMMMDLKRFTANQIILEIEKRKKIGSLTNLAIGRKNIKRKVNIKFGKRDFILSKSETKKCLDKRLNTFI